MRKSRTHGRRFGVPHAATVALGLACGASTNVANADISGESVVHGDVTFTHSGNQIVITASDGAIINYMNFDVAAWETIQFIQPHEMARVLNRVTGPDPSVIEGTLKANGYIYIVNPAGVYFTGSAVVDVSGIFAAGGEMKNSHFLNGVNKFTNLTGSVVNEGTVMGDAVHFMGSHVANHGLIDAHRGVVTMVAGDEVVMKRHGGRVVVRVDGKTITGRNRVFAGGTTPDMTATPGVENTGTILADRGQVVLGAGDLYGLAIHNTGTVQADRGHVSVVATDGLIQNDGVISANSFASQAGDVVVQGPSILNRGTISADTEHGRAGNVVVTSQNHTYLTSSSVISASGRSGDGHGGDILIHSYDGLTVHADGALVDVSGGRYGGHGGFAEISGKSVTVNGSVDTYARHGYQHGALLIDPFNIIINETGGDDAFLEDGIITFFEGGDDDAIIAANTLKNIFGLIHLQAQGSIFVDAEVNLDLYNDVLFEAGAIITVREPITGAKSLRFFADFDNDGFGYVAVNVPLTVGEDIVMSGDHIRLNGNSITSGTTQDYFGDVWLATDMLVEGSRINFWDRVDTKFDEDFRTMRIAGDVNFYGEVGGNKELLSLEVDGSTYVGGGLVRTRLGQSYDGLVNIGSDTTFESLQSGDIAFNDALDAGGPVGGGGAFAAGPPVDIIVNSQGTTSFNGPVGANSNIGLVMTDAGGTTEIGANMTADSLDFGDFVVLKDDVTLTGPSMIALRAGGDGGPGWDLNINSELTILGGTFAGLGQLTTDAAGTTELAAQIDADRIDIRDTARLTGNTVLDANEWINFDRTIDGAHELHLLAGDWVELWDNVGSNERLASLRFDVGSGAVSSNLIRLHGDEILTTGNILFNPLGRTTPSSIATIAAYGDLLVDSQNGDIRMGQGERFTALGDLAMNALNGTVRLGDINTLGDFDVNANAIELWARSGSEVLAADGTFAEDAGSDLVIGGNLFMSTAPSVVGSGATPVIAVGGSANSALDAFDIQDVTVTAGDLEFGGLVLDLIASLPSDDTPVPSPPPGEGTTQLSSNLAEGLEDDLREIEDRVIREAISLEALEDLGLFLRTISADEFLNRTASDLGGASLTGDDRVIVSATRLDRNLLITVVNRYATIFSPEGGEDADAAGRIRRNLDAAWKAYQASPTRQDESFRMFAAASEDHALVAGYLDGLADIFENLRLAGATSREVRISKDTLLGSICPPSMREIELEEAIEM